MIKDFSKDNLLSIAIPAYNNPDYLYKCLYYLSKQTYQKLEIIISDDCSPRSLRQTYEKCKKFFSKKVKIYYFEQKVNLGVYWNLMFVINKCTGKFITFMQHDDWLIDKNFYKDSMFLFNSDNDVNVVIANSYQEFTKQRSMDISNIDWLEIEGVEYISENLFFDMHPIYSAVVYRLDSFKNNYKGYFISKINADKMGVEIDECFVALILAASSGKIKISGKIVCVQGKPVTAATNLMLHMYKKKGMDVGMFIPYYKLYKYFMFIKNYKCVSEMKRLMIFEFCVRKINFKVISFLGWEIASIRFMILSYCYRVFRAIKNKVYDNIILKIS